MDSTPGLGLKICGGTGLGTDGQATVESGEVGNWSGMGRVRPLCLCERYKGDAGSEERRTLRERGRVDGRGTGNSEFLVGFVEEKFYLSGMGRVSQIREKGLCV